jgi:hypothetical protein
MNFGNLSISNTICTAALTTIAFTKQQWCSWRMCPKGCAVDYDKYSKMLAINTNHKDDDPDFNEFVPATTEAEYINLKLKMATMKKDYLHEQNSLVFCGVLHQHPILDSRFSTAKNRKLQKVAGQLSVPPSSQFAKSMAGSGGTGNCVFIGP